MPTSKGLPLVLNPPLALDPDKHPVALIGTVIEDLRRLFPEVPLNGHHWTLRPNPQREKQAQLILRLANGVDLIMQFEQEASMGYLRVPGALLGTGMPSGSVERMALRNECETDIKGWLSLAKTTYEDRFQPPLRFEVSRVPQGKLKGLPGVLLIVDARKGRDIEFPKGSVVEVHPNLKAIRAETGVRRPTDLDDWSWTHVENGIALVANHLTLIKPVTVERYKVNKRYGFYDLIARESFRFTKGETVEVRSDGTAIRLAKDDLAQPEDPTHPSWKQLDPDQTTGTIKKAIKTGALYLYPVEETS